MAADVPASPSEHGYHDQHDITPIKSTCTCEAKSGEPSTATGVGPEDRHKRLHYFEITAEDVVNRYKVLEVVYKHMKDVTLDDVNKLHLARN